MLIYINTKKLNQLLRKIIKLIFQMKFCRTFKILKAIRAIRLLIKNINYTQICKKRKKNYSMPLKMIKNPKKINWKKFQWKADYLKVSPTLSN